MIKYTTQIIKLYYYTYLMKYLNKRFKNIILILLFRVINIMQFLV